MLTTPDKRLALQAYERILDLIQSRQARPGDLINERQLAEALEMSRTPVRDALLMLEAEGLLVRQGKRGMQVKEMKVEDFLDALQIRMLLEPEVSRMAAASIPAAELAGLRQRFEALIASASNDGHEVDREEVRAVDEGLHGLIAECAGNQQLSSIIRTLRRQTQIFDLRSVPERFEATCREHIAIIDALAARDGDKASGAMAHHLDAVRASIINRLIRT